MGGDPEVSAVNRITVDAITGDVYQAGTINLIRTDGPKAADRPEATDGPQAAHRPHTTDRPHATDEPEVAAESTAAACAAYARRVRETYGRLDLEVLTPLSEQGEHPVVELREVFVTPQVREDPPPVELPRELVQRLVDSEEFTAEALPDDLGPSALERLRAEYLSRPTEDVLAVLAEARGARLVLLGDPGSGKSTLARYLALTLSHRAGGPLAPLDGLVPLVVELRQYAEGQWRERTFEDSLDHRHRVAGMSLPQLELRRLLTGGEALVVFDGLDELFDPGVRAATAERIAAFAARYDRTRVVVTSRVIGYQRAALDGAGFTHVMLQDLAPDRIADFARRWYAIACPTDPDLAARLVERITGAVDASRPIRELAGNPLLLTILAITGRRQTLPRDRRGVYEHAVRILVAHWDRDTKHLRTPLKPGAAEAIGLLDDRELEGLAHPDADGPETVSLLTGTAVGSENAEMRLTALNLLAEHRGSHVETVRIILDRVVQDPDPQVRGVALSHYAVLAPDTAEVTVHTRAVEDSAPAVRRRALTMLAWQWPDRPGTVAALEHAKASDPDRHVRNGAKAGLEAVAHLISASS